MCFFKLKMHHNPFRAPGTFWKKWGADGRVFGIFISAPLVFRFLYQKVLDCYPSWHYGMRGRCR